MNISKITYAILTAAMLLTFNSCDKGADDVDPDNYREENVKEIEKAKVISKSTADSYEIWTDGYKSFARKAAKFSNKMAAEIGCKSEGNTAISPLSVFTALSMAAECADGGTRQEILDAMGLTYDELNASIKNLCASCNRILDRGMETSENEIKCVNSLWVVDGVPLKQDGLNALSTNYRSDVFKMDFANSDVNKLVTSYIKNETKGFLSPDLQIPNSTLIMLMNVVYLREVWNTYGSDLSLTDENYDFVNADNSKVNGRLLSGYYSTGRALIKEKYRKFKTHTNSGFTLTFFVPNDGFSVDDIYTEEVLNDETGYVYEDEENLYHTRCLFPEFSADYEAEIQDFIMKLGIEKFFTPACDFGHLTDAGVMCGKIKHVAKLDVKKSGIEGAAVTVAMMKESANDPGEKVLKDVYEDFIVDRGFVYVLSNESGIPLFTGTVKKIK